MDDRRKLKSEVAALTTGIARLSTGDLLDTAEDINGIKVIAAEFPGSVEAMRGGGPALIGTGVVVLGSTLSGVKLIAAVTRTLLERKRMQESSLKPSLH